MNVSVFGFSFELVLIPYRFLHRWDKICIPVDFYIYKKVMILFLKNYLYLLTPAMCCYVTAAAAAKLFQSCPTLCDPRDGSSPGSPVPGILQARTLEWVAISFSNAWKWKVKVKLLSRVELLATPWTQPTRLLHPWDFPGKSTGVGCHCLLQQNKTGRR